MKRSIQAIPLIIAAFMLSWGCNQQKSVSTDSDKTSININTQGSGPLIELEFNKGKYHNHPSFAVWVEDMNENYIQTLFVTQYVATGVFGHGSAGEGKWKTESGSAERPASMPYWLHKRSVAEDVPLLPSPDSPVPDAYSGPTPKAGFRIDMRTSDPLPEKFRLMLEINQPWDWNDEWFNDRYPDDADYKTSAQPSLIYVVTVNQLVNNEVYYMNPIGHGHYSGKDGKLYTDISGHTTALQIASQIKVILKQASIED